MKFLFLVTLILAIFVDSAVSRDWRGIKPGVSSRSDVIRILGPESGAASKAPDYYDFYYLRDWSVTIEYYSDLAPHETGKDIVNSIDVYPKKRIYISEVAEDLSAFRKETGESDIPGLAFYTNYKDGFVIEVQKPRNAKDEVVTGFSYFEPALTK